MTRKGSPGSTALFLVLAAFVLGSVCGYFIGSQRLNAVQALKVPSRGFSSLGSEQHLKGSLPAHLKDPQDSSVLNAVSPRSPNDPPTASAVEGAEAGTVTPFRQLLRAGARGMMTLSRLGAKRQYGGSLSPEENRQWSAAAADFLKLTSDFSFEIGSPRDVAAKEDYSVAVLEEGGLLASDADRSIAEWLARDLAQRIKAAGLKNPLPGELALEQRRAIEEFVKNAAAAFPGMDDSKVVGLVYALSGGTQLSPGLITSLSDSRDQTVDNILDGWDPKKELTAQERAEARIVASTYLQAYLDLRGRLLAQYAPDFANMYFFSGATQESASGLYNAKGQWPATNPPYAVLAWKLDNQLMGLSAAAQQQLASVLPPDKQGVVQSMPVGVRHFPGVR